MSLATRCRLACIALALTGITATSPAAAGPRDFVAATSPPLAAAERPAQTTGAEPECKKDPDDPRCRDKK